MGRVDYYHQDDAPPANSIVVAVTVFVEDDQGRVLLICRGDSGLWALPGGAQDIGERLTETAAREVQEETGIDIEVIELVGLYSDPHHVIAYDDGEVRQEFSICFRGVRVGGTIATSEESPDVRWVKPVDIASLEMHPSMRMRVEHGVQHRGEVYLG